MAKSKYVRNVKRNGDTYNWGGTLLNGTKTTAVVVVKSGLPAVKKDDTYLNTSTGNVYVCTQEGTADKAKWKYLRTVLVAKPRGGVAGLTLSRDGNGSRVMRAKWKVPKAIVDSSPGKGGDRATGLRRRWKFDTSAKKKVNILDKEDTANERNEACSENLANFEVKSGAKVKKFTRASFYPHKGKPKLKSVTFVVTPYNAYGNGKPQSVTREFSEPLAPKFDKPSFNAQTGEVSIAMTTDPGNGLRERLWTSWELKVTDTSKPKKRQTFTDKSNGSDEATSRTLTYDAQGYQGLTPDQYVKVWAEATAKGFAGDSKSTSQAYYVAFPKAATIEPKGTKVRVTSNDSASKVSVPIKVNATKEHPTDRVKLQKLVSVPYTKASQIPGDAPWEDTGSVDDGECTSLVADLADLVPSEGAHTWIRVKSWHGSEESLHTYSKPRKLDELYTARPSAEDDECAVLSAKPLLGGESARVVIGYDAKDGSSRDDATGTVLEWSDDAEAWESTEAPERHEFTWSDKTVAPEAAGKFYKSQTIKVKGLDEGVTYWFRARRYMDDADGNRTYGPYGDAVQCTTASVPVDDSVPSITGVALTAPPTVARGRGIACEWTIAAQREQESWAVIASTGQVLASGEGPAEACTVPWERVEPYVADGAVSLFARIACGGQFADSGTWTVRVLEPPTLEVVASDLTAQPFEFEVRCSEPGASVSWGVLSEGCSGDSAAGSYFQAPGDVVAGGVDSPELAETAVGDETLYVGTVRLGTGLGFHDGCAYRVVATAESAVTGLASERAEATFAVDWARKAPAPSGDIAVSVDDAAHVATITLVAPQDAGEDDVYDVYRVTHDGVELISRPQGLPLDYEAVDRFAPFGDAGDYRYRVSCRTPDGSEEWADFDYSDDAGVLRFDWDTTFVELPYSIEVSDAFEKDSEVRPHMDGEREGFWNGAVARSASLSTALMRIEDAESVAAVRALAQHAGPVFVRTPDGSAYAADVQANALDVAGNALLCSFSAQQVTTSESYRLPLPPGAEEQQEQGQG